MLVKGATESNFAVSAEATTVYNGFESYTFETIAASSRGQGVQYILAWQLKQIEWTIVFKNIIILYAHYLFLALGWQFCQHTELRELSLAVMWVVVVTNYGTAKLTS